MGLSTTPASAWTVMSPRPQATSHSRQRASDGRIGRGQQQQRDAARAAS